MRAAILVRAIAPELSAKADEIKAEIAALHDTRRQAVLASEDLFVTDSDVAQGRAQIEALIAKKTAQEQSAEAEAAKADQDLQTLNARLRALNGVARSAPPAANAPQPPDPEHAGLFGRPKPFTAPVGGAPVALFNAPEPDGGRAHGWTWRPAPNSAVVAPADGVVDYVGALKGWGVVVILRLGGGYHLVLAGMDESQRPVRPNGQGGRDHRPHGGVRPAAGALLRNPQERRGDRPRPLDQAIGANASVLKRLRAL